MSSKVNVGIIGAGRIGRIHAENLAHRIPQAEVLAISDIVPEAAQKCAAELGIPTAVEDHRAIMENPKISAVVICSSTDTHSQFIEEAAAARKHIFCEKPIDFDLTRIDRALAAVEDSGVSLQIGFNRRFDPNFRRVKELVAAGKVGEPHVLRITSRDPEPPPIEYVKVSGGIFLDMTIHDFDMARYLIDSEVEEIYAAGGVMVDPQIGEAGDIDTAVITLRFANGVIGTIDNSRKAVYGYDQRVEVFGSGGAVAVSNNRPNSAVVSDAEGVHGPLPLNFFLERYMDSYIAEMNEFIECVQEKRPPSVTGIDGRIPVIMGYAARMSYEENRPVRLNEIAPV
ncbi:MAG: inositol 2-dehydrogenase [Armatimonadetes bacterium]|nr:inositol 2-dehydrogenase [Armatimonadota bacterium]NIO75053.1 inositol 2-dehydrogenase [Armatimonadota bacterium]NIO95703.1 inositol 2-dehydrogenase [Armatimonadota bacterium]